MSKAAKAKAISTTVLSILGMVFAAMVLIFSAIPCIGYYALIPSIVAFIFAIVGIVYLKKAGKSLSLPIMSVLLSTIAIASSVYQYIEFKEIYETKERLENSLNHFEEKVQNEAEDAVIDYTKEKIHDLVDDDKDTKKNDKKEAKSSPEKKEEKKAADQEK